MKIIIRNKFWSFIFFINTYFDFLITQIFMRRNNELSLSAETEKDKHKLMNVNRQHAMSFPTQDTNLWPKGRTNMERMWVNARILRENSTTSLWWKHVSKSIIICKRNWEEMKSIRISRWKLHLTVNERRSHSGRAKFKTTFP